MELESNLKSAYMEAYILACKKLSIMDAEAVALNTNSIYDRTSGKLTVKYLNKDYSVNCNTGDVQSTDPAMEVTTTQKVLILHYLVNASIKPLSGKHISFKDLKGGGAIYYQTFHKRAIQPLIKSFGQDAALLAKAGSCIGGVKERYGTEAVTINVFPLVPITYIVWEGDDEVPANATILFDESVDSFLPDEDIVLAASFGAYELMGMAKALKH